MQVISIKLTNFKQFRETEVTFSEGLTGFIGKNGAGKSTIFEAIAYALFGRVDTSLAEIRNDKAADNAAVEVILCFEDKGQDYKVIRRITGKNNTSAAELYRGEQPVCSGTTAVNKEVSRLLKSDYKNFNLSFFARQKEVGQIQALNKSERSGHIRQMLGLSKLDRLEELLREEIKALESELKGMRLNLMSNEQVAELNNNLIILISEAEEINANIEVSLREVTAAENAKTEAIRNFKAAQELQSKYNLMNSKIDVKQTEIESTEKAILKLTAEIAVLENKADEYKSKSGIRTDYRLAEEKLAALRIIRDTHLKREQLLKNLASHVESLNKVQQDFLENTDKLNALTGIGVRAEAKLRETEILSSAYEENKNSAALLERALEPLKAGRLKDEERLGQIKKLGKDADCPECERPLGEHLDFLIGKYTESINGYDVQINSLNAQLDQFSIRGETLSGQISAEKAILTDLQLKNSEAEKLKAVNSALQDQSKEKELLIKEIGQELAEMGEINFDNTVFAASEQNVASLKKENEALSKLEGEISELPVKKGELPELRQKLNTLNTTLAELRDEIHELGYNPVVFDRIQTERDEAENNLLEKEKNLSGLRNRRDVKISETKGIRNRLSDNDNNIKAVEDAENTKLLYDKLRQTVTSFKNMVTSRELPEISRIASRLFSKITGGRYEDLKISEDFELYVSRDSKSVLLSTLSGGEKDLAALCIRIALSKRISTLAGRNNMGFLALDEVFGSQDQERRDELMRTLNAISAEFRQIFVVSHNEDVQEAFPNRIVISRKGGFSEAVLVRA